MAPPPELGLLAASLALVGGCAGKDGPSADPIEVGPIEVVGSTDIAQAAWVTVSTDPATRATLTVDDGTRGFEVAFPDLRTEHVLPVLGVGAGRQVELAVRLQPEAGEPVEVAVPTWTSGVPPVALPDIEVLVHEPERVEPGFLLLPMQRGVEGVTLLLDETLEPVWVWPLGFSDVRRTPEGTLLGIRGGELHELDMLGRLQVKEARGLHHEAFLADDGTIWSLTAEAVQVDAYPVSTETPDILAPAEIQADVVLQLDRDGHELRRLPLVEVLDTQRVSHGATGRTRDWLHVNGLAVDPSDGDLVLFARHQDALVKVSPDGQLRWILGDPAGWRAPWSDLLLDPVDALWWPRHSHAPQVLDDGTIVLFDNRNSGSTPYGGEPEPSGTSRAVAYRVDGSEVRQLWSFDETATGPLFAQLKGDADVLPVTGNVLLSYGHLEPGSGDPGEHGERWSRFVEVDPTGRPVLDVRVTAGGGPSHTAYRGEKVPSLYPDGVLVTPLER